MYGKIKEGGKDPDVEILHLCLKEQIAKIPICPHHCILLIQWYHPVTCKPFPHECSLQEPLNTNHPLLLLKGTISSAFMANLTPNSLALMLAFSGVTHGRGKVLQKHQ